VLADLDGKDQGDSPGARRGSFESVRAPCFRAAALEPATMKRSIHRFWRLPCAAFLKNCALTVRVAAERVQASRQPFRLNPMSSRERRIVHLALKI